MCRKMRYLILLVSIAGWVAASAGAADLAPDLLWWAFDEGEGTAATDQSGSGHDGVITGAEWVVPGALGNGSALYFDGSGDIVEDDDAEDYLNGIEAVTVAMWIKADAVPTDKGFINGEPPDDGDNVFTMRYDSAGANGGGASVFKMAITSTGGEQQLESSENLQTTEWQHVAMTWSSGEQIRFYVDGVEDTPTNNSAGVEGTIDSCNTLIIGQGGKDAGASWAGVIDEVVIFSRALEPEEVYSVMDGLGSTELASDPNPVDEATDVLRDTTLAWTPGEFAATHDVYLGSSFDDVDAAGADVLVSQGQADTAYVPEDVFKFGQTYYWRVDEVQADGTVIEGEVWSFTVEPEAYPVEGIVATSNASSSETAGAEKTVDGSGLDENDQHSTDSPDMWLGAAAEGEATWLQYEFNRVYKLYEMLVWNYNVEFESVLGFGVKDVTVEYSVDGVEWTVLGDFEFAQAITADVCAVNAVVDFAGAAVQFVRLTVNSSWGGGTSYGLSEVRFLYVPVLAREPEPAADATSVAVDSALAWRSGREAASHDVYFGTDAEALTLAGTVAENTFVPDSLNYGQTYYWQVIEVNEAEAVSAWEGDVWSFSTLECAVVDDFESYNDEDNLIYEAWEDGWFNETGSTVGYLEAPFAEQTIVHSGGQSMPLTYVNDGVTTAEADLTLSDNWTASGIQSLSLYVYGDADNTGELFVEINGTKVAFDGDITAARWQHWNIDLAATGASLSNVKTLTIGVEGSGAEGVVYIDDVCLYPRLAEYVVPSEPDAANLVASYQFEGNANDGSSNGLNGTIVDGQLVSPGKLGDGMALQVNDAGYADLGNPSALDFATEDWTVSGWYKTGMTGTGDDNKGTVYGKGGDTGGGHRYCLIMSETNEGAMTLVTDDDVTKVVVDSTSVTNDDEWHCVAGQRNGTALNIYVDGVLEATGTCAADYDLSGTVQHNGYIGAITNHGDGSLYKTFIGLIDDVRVYNGALSEAEILWLAGVTYPVAKPF